MKGGFQPRSLKSEPTKTAEKRREEGLSFGANLFQWPVSIPVANVGCVPLLPTMQVSEGGAYVKWEWLHLATSNPQFEGQNLKIPPPC